MNLVGLTDQFFVILDQSMAPCNSTFLLIESIPLCPVGFLRLDQHFELKKYIHQSCPCFKRKKEK